MRSTILTILQDSELNYALFHKTRPDQADIDSWNSPATVQDALDVLADFHPAVLALTRHADTMACYVLGRREVIPRITRGRVAIIGDAAHPMHPTHQQGGSSSLEDAAALEVLFEDCENGQVQQRLSIYHQLRLPRDAVAQLTSNAMFHYEPLDDSVARIREYWKGPLSPLGAVPWSEPIWEFFHGYDAFAEAEKALKYKDDPNGLPEGAIRHFGGD